MKNLLIGTITKKFTPSGGTAIAPLASGITYSRCIEVSMCRKVKIEISGKTWNNADNQVTVNVLWGMRPLSEYADATTMGQMLQDPTLSTTLVPGSNLALLSYQFIVIPDEKILGQFMRLQYNLTGTGVGSSTLQFTVQAEYHI